MITIVYAHEPEVQALKNLVKEAGLDDRLTWRRWRNSSDRLFIEGEPDTDFILNVGFAGRLNPALSLGEVAVALPCGSASRLIAGRLKQVSLITVVKPVLDERERETLRKRTGADIVDMEAGFLADLATTRNIPFAAVKLISDTAGPDGRAEINRRLDEWSKRLAARVYGLVGDLLEI